MIIKLQEKYKKEVVPEMMKRFGYKNVMAVPRIEKTIINIGFGKRVYQKTSKEKQKIQKLISESLGLISGQKPVLTKARKSISGFKVRRGMVVGAKVTLRKNKMNNFLDRLIHIALPRTRDFQGIDRKSIDSSGNLTLGIKEHIIFPEISTERMQDILSFQVTVTTNARTKEQGLVLLKLLGFPIKEL